MEAKYSLQYIMQNQDEMSSSAPKVKPRVLFKVTLDQINFDLSYTHNPESHKLENKSSNQICKKQQLLVLGSDKLPKQGGQTKIYKVPNDKSHDDRSSLSKIMKEKKAVESESKIDINNNLSINIESQMVDQNKGDKFNQNPVNKFIIQQAHQEQQQFQFVDLSVAAKHDEGSNQSGNQRKLPTKKMNKIQTTKQRQPANNISTKVGKSLITIIKQQTPPESEHNKKKKKKRTLETQKRLTMELLNKIKNQQTIIGVKGDDEVQSEKPASESEQLRQRAVRNRRIVVYIKRTLQSTRAIGGITLRELYVSIFKNYEKELSLIKDDKKRYNRFDSLRRRIQEYLKVLSAVDIISKSNDYQNGSQVVKLQKNDSASLNLREKKSKLQKMINQKQQRIRYLKQVYFDSLTRKRALDSLRYRNENIHVPPSNRVSLVMPIRCFMVAAKQGFQLIVKKSNQSCRRVDCITIKSKQIDQIHTIDYFVSLRRILKPMVSVQTYGWLRQNLKEQYLRSINIEDQSQKNKVIRLGLIQKMKQRNSLNAAQRKQRRQQKDLRKHIKNSIKQLQMIQGRA